MPQGYVTFGTLPTTHILGGELTLSWGTSPSAATILMLPIPDLVKQIGTLTFNFGGDVVSMADCALAPSTLRIHQFRPGHVWSLQIFDRRWRWRYATISGTYNVRGCDGRVVASTRKTLSELFGLLFSAMGETYSLTGIPDVYPTVSWANSRCDLALGLLAERYGCVPMLKPNDIAAVDAIGSGSVLTDSLDGLHAEYLYGLSVKPSQVRVVAGSTVFQQKIRLKAVGIESTGERKDLDMLSYEPSNLWQSQWATTLTGVPPASRHLALDTVWRWFELDPPETIGGVPIESVAQIKLRTHAAELMTDTDEITTYCAPARIKGTWFPNTLYPENVTDAWFPGPFTICPDESLVKFDYPVYQWNADGPQPPELDLYTSFTLETPDGEPVTADEIGSVPLVTYATEPRVDRFGDLVVVDVIDSAWGASQSNEPEIRAELMTIRDALIGTYQGEKACDYWVEGLRPIALNGSIAQIRWRCYVDRAATTRASCHTEFDTHAMAFSEHRRQQRSNLLANEVLFR